MDLPRWVERLVRALAPAEFADDLLDDFTDRYRALGQARRNPRVWLLTELLRTPWLRLGRQARRMRSAGSRREMPSHGTADLDALGSGLRVAARSLSKRPLHSSLSVLTLATSIGAATLVFSVLEGVLLRPLPYEGGERVHRIFATNQAWRTAEQELLRDVWDRLDLTRDMVSALRGRVPGAEALGAYAKATLRLDDGEDPVELPGAQLLPGFFETLPMAPLLGRLPFASEVESGAPVVVLGERMWTSRYGRDAGILGRSVSLNGVPHTVIGVLPAAFAVPDELARWWAPLPPGGRTDQAHFVGLVRLAPGYESTDAVEGLARVGEQLAESNAVYATMGVRLQPISELLVADVRDGLLLLFLGVGVVLLIGSVNLANLTVAGTARRRSELAMRAALGASRWELVWTLLSEVSLICVIGALLGVLAATQLLDPLLALLSRATDGFPRADAVGVNAVVLGFSAAVTCITVLLAGLLPALSASRPAPWEALQQSRRSRGGRAVRRTQRSLLLVEAALATVLLTLAGLLTRSALHVSRIDPGFATERIAYLTVETAGERYDSDVEAEALGSALEARLRALPDVESVARASALPGLGNADAKLVWLPEESAESARMVWASAVSPEYFGTMGIRVVAGRAFTSADRAGGAAVVVISQLFADRFFPGESPVGKTIRVSTDTRIEGGEVVAGAHVEPTVVGVVSDVRQLTVVLEPDPVLYRPIAQARANALKLIVRTSGPPTATLDAARAEVRALDPSLLVSAKDGLERAMSRLFAPVTVRTALIIVLAALAAFLTAVGIYGVVAHVVSDQLHEIGVRIALGARAAGESGRVIRHALGPVLGGALLGLPGAWVVGRLLGSDLFGVSPLDPPTYLGVLVLVTTVTCAAAWIPARRAASVDPMRVLNDE